MKTVYLTTVENNIQASLVKDVLHEAGIECLAKNETLNSVLSYGPSFQIEIFVLESDYTKAMAILKEGFPELV